MRARVRVRVREKTLPTKDTKVTNGKFVGIAFFVVEKELVTTKCAKVRERIFVALWLGAMNKFLLCSH